MGVAAQEQLPREQECAVADPSQGGSFWCLKCGLSKSSGMGVVEPSFIFLPAFFQADSVLKKEENNLWVQIFFFLMPLSVYMRWCLDCLLPGLYLLVFFTLIHSLGTILNKRSPLSFK